MPLRLKVRSCASRMLSSEDLNLPCRMYPPLSFSILMCYFYSITQKLLLTRMGYSLEGSSTNCLPSLGNKNILESAPWEATAGSAATTTMHILAFGEWPDKRTSLSQAWAVFGRETLNHPWESFHYSLPDWRHISSYLCLAVPTGLLALSLNGISHATRHQYRHSNPEELSGPSWTSPYSSKTSFYCRCHYCFSWALFPSYELFITAACLIPVESVIFLASGSNF